MAHIGGTPCERGNTEGREFVVDTYFALKRDGDHSIEFNKNSSSGRCSETERY